MIKHLSIKTRITIWYGVFMVAMTAIILALLFFVSERVLIGDTENVLKSAVSEAAVDLEYENGNLEIDEEAELLAQGIYISVYDENKRLVTGTVPKDWDKTTALSSGNLTTLDGYENSWYVYDEQVQLGSDMYWVRGAVTTSGGFPIIIAILFCGAVGVFLVLSITGGYIVAKRALRPVGKITETVRDIEESKDLSRRIDLGKGSDEIYTMAGEFDDLLARLEAVFAAEKQFTQDASHELRTPISVIIAQAEFALINSKTEEEYKEALETILGHSQKMSAMVDQLLLLARHDSGRAKMAAKSVNLSMLADVAADQAKGKAGEKDISIKKEISPGLFITGDELLLLRMLTNLIENGIKYGKSGGWLKIQLYASSSCEAAGSGDTFTTEYRPVGASSQGSETAFVIGEISDDGIGISEEDLPKIWDRFYRADPSHSSSFGNGLGLSMVKYICEAHGGSVSCMSTLGEGSMFRFCLPIASA